MTEAQASAEGFDRGVKEAQPIVESLRAELHALYDAIGFDPLDLENGHDNARAAIDALLKAEREKAMREAADLADELAIEMEVYHAIPTTTTKSKALCIRNRILALISEDKTDE